MANLGLISKSKTPNSVIVSFRIPYFTHWGEQILVCGSAPILGSGNVKKGLLLSPSHQGDELIWSGNVPVAVGLECEYSYYVVDDGRNVLRWEAGKKRKLLLPGGAQNGDLVEVHDLWQTGSDDLPFRSAFKNVIFRQSSNLKVERPPPATLGQEADSVIVQFKICCPYIEEDTSIYVIGSSLNLGQWRAQGGLKLSYAGDSVWQAELAMQKNDFPLKYP